MRITEALEVLDNAGLSVDEFRRRTQLDRASQNRLLKTLAEDVSMSMGEVSRRARVPYGSVRGSFAYLGLSAGEGVREAQKALRARRAELIRAEMKRTPWATRRAIATRLEMPYHMVCVLMTEEGIERERIPRHGTAVEYDHFGCRCDVCREGNRLRCRATKADRKTRPQDIPHGTMTAYWNWNCRCAECRVVGSRVNKMRVEPEPGTVVKLHVRWTEEEDRIVMEGGTARSVAARLGRSIGAVNTRRATLRGRAAA